MADNLTPKEEFLLNPVTEHNITDAAIASFETNFKHPVKVTVPITPVQDLHGYDYPWPAGGSANLIPDGQDASNGYLAGAYLNADGTTSAGGGWYVSEYFLVSAGETYMWSTNQTSVGAASTCFYDENKQYISGESANGELPKAIVAPENAVYCRTSQLTTGKLCQIEKGSTVTSIVPYSNICPIEGSTGCCVWQGRVNILPQIDGGYYSIFLPKGTNVIASVAYTTQLLRRVIYYRKDKSLIDYFGFNFPEYNNTRSRTAPFTLKEDAYYFSVTSGLNDFQLEFGSTVSPYMAPQSTSLPISWKHAEGTYNFESIQAGEGDPSPENVRPISPALTLTRDDNSVLTVYGGSITFRDDGTSILVSTVAITDLGELTYSKANVSSTWPYGYFVTYVPLEKLNKVTDPFLMCSCYPDGGTGDPKAVISNPVGSIIYFIDSDYTNSTAEEFKASLNGQTLAYKLLNSTTYVLSQAETQRVITALGDKVVTTVYGGTVTVNEDGSADIVANYTSREYDGSNDESWSLYTAQNGFQIRVSSEWQYYAKGWCNALNTVRSASAYAENTCVFGLATSCFYAIRVSALLTEYTVAAWRTYLANNPLQVVFKLNTPKTYHFPNVGQLKAFLGTNNIWSDIGNVNVKYLTQNSATGLEYRGDRALELRRRAMIGDAPTIHTTVGSDETGGLASFKSYIKAPVKKIEIPFGPKQDLHGYDNPWPAGAGGNVLHIEDQEITQYKSVTLDDPISVSSNSKYTLSLDATTTDTDTGLVSVILHGESGYDYAASSFSTTGRSAKIIQFNYGDDSINSIRFYASSGGVSQGAGDVATFSNIKLEAGEVATPYSNICPISGWTGMNIYDLDNISQYYGRTLYYSPVQEGVGIPSPTNRRPVHGYTLKRDNGTTITTYGGRLDVNANGTSRMRNSWRLYTWTGNETFGVSGGGHYRVYTQQFRSTMSSSESLGSIVCNVLPSAPSSDTYFGAVGISKNTGSLKDVYLCVQEKTVHTADMVKNWIINTGDVQMIYHASSYDGDYNLSVAETRRFLAMRYGITLPITFTDPTTGDPLTLYDGTVTINPDGSADVVSTMGNIASYDGETLPSAWISSMDVYAEGTTPTTGAQVVYELATPQTYHFSNLEQLKVWLGKNNFWCDISDDITVKYWNRG